MLAKHLGPISSPFTSALATYDEPGSGTSIAQCFGKAASTYVGAARLQRQVAYAALTTLLQTKASTQSMNVTLPEQHISTALSPAILGDVVDLGCGPGWLHAELLPLSQQLTAIDLSVAMLLQAAEQGLAIHYVQADAAALPLPSQSVDSVFSSLMLQWCPAPARVLSEVCRILKPGGRAVMTTLIAGTLAELAQAFTAVDDKPHIHAFLQLSDLQTAIMQTEQLHGVTWHLQTQCYSLPYTDIFALARELKALGANHLAQRAQRGLTGKGYWQKVASAYPKTDATGTLQASYQVVQLVACKQD
ncbi:methyltransferase domain-containing protein [Alishewanella tabrizica]|uniref:Malonyl-[acyl-carrier protein] O-methyltransferase n=1 Tax=Alishewanella tabrizica TaxID=671278 RepID=A0ABQ2WLM8_9ALTE|nr:methyltransferase domain-containing protein [Alishewanella tabrizica]GGW58043.1 malonyl-[acyl-carrier protein] O-methyltransferase [Alishewanella tabrizica]